MTYGRPGTSLAASPERVGEAICRAIARGTDVAYTPWFWWRIMLITRSIPERGLQAPPPLSAVRAAGVILVTGRG